MQKFQFKTYQRNNPAVLALKFETGMESAWAAFDFQGRVLGTASTEVHARQASPGAILIAPIIDLPGLSTEPLVFGNYIVLMQNGLYAMMTARDFEAAHTAVKPATK